MSNFNILWCFIIPLITAIVGWLLGRFMSNETSSEDNNNDELNAKIASLKADLEACKSSKRKLSDDLDACLASKASAISGTAAATGLGIANALTSDSSTEPELIFDAAAAKLALGKKIIADDLKIVEGIGPKISELFNDNGITTWYQLSKATVERCQEILNKGGKRYEIHNPSTWPKQAGLAFEGKWKELNELQDYLDGGVDPNK